MNGPIYYVCCLCVKNELNIDDEFQGFSTSTFFLRYWLLLLLLLGTFGANFS